MATYRMVKTKFWTDPYVLSLTPDEKLVFLYLLTNPQTHICGIYEISQQYISLETGVPGDSVSQALDRLCTDCKVLLVEGWVFVVNFWRHQSDNPSVQEGIKKGIELVPDHILEEFKTACTQAGDKTSVTILNLTKLNLTKLEGTKLKETEKKKKVTESGFPIPTYDDLMKSK